MRAIRHGRSNSNPLLCSACFGQLRKYPGGADVEISVLFADIRGSTGIAERTTAGAFRSLLQGFYKVSTSAIERYDGMVDKFLGDGVMALFIPVMTGENHSARAIQAGEELIAGSKRPELAAGGIQVGAGIHSGTAFVGVIGAEEHLDFTALGDTVNVAARLGSLAGPGELLVSGPAWERSGQSLEGLDAQEMEVKGRSAPLDVVILRPAAPGSAIEVPA
jgi:adenylate cyclase